MLPSHELFLSNISSQKIRSLQIWRKCALKKKKKIFNISEYCCFGVIFRRQYSLVEEKAPLLTTELRNSPSVSILCTIVEKPRNNPKTRNFYGTCVPKRCLLDDLVERCPQGRPCTLPALPGRRPPRQPPVGINRLGNYVISR